MWHSSPKLRRYNWKVKIFIFDPYFFILERNRIQCCQCICLSKEIIVMMMFWALLTNTAIILQIIGHKFEYKVKLMLFLNEHLFTLSTSVVLSSLCTHRKGPQLIEDHQLYLIRTSREPQPTFTKCECSHFYLKSEYITLFICTRVRSSSTHHGFVRPITMRLQAMV